MQRRDFLTRAPVALAVIGTPAAAAAVQAPAENPALLALGEDLPKVEAAYRAASEARRDAWRLWSKQWPLAPDACCNLDWCGWSDRAERDLSGAALIRPGRDRPVRVNTVREMEDRAELMRKCLAKDNRRKRKESKKTRAYWQGEIARCELGVQLLPSYLAECDRIRLESAYDTLRVQQDEARRALFALARAALAEKASTSRGLKIKAEICAALGAMGAYDVNFGQIEDATRNPASNMAALLASAVLDAI